MHLKIFCSSSVTVALHVNKHLPLNLTVLRFAHQQHYVHFMNALTVFDFVKN